MAFSPDGQLLASGSFHATVRVWDVCRATERRCFRGHGGRARSIDRCVHKPGGARTFRPIPAAHGLLPATGILKSAWDNSFEWLARQRLILLEAAGVDETADRPESSCQGRLSSNLDRGLTAGRAKFTLCVSFTPCHDSARRAAL